MTINDGWTYYRKGHEEEARRISLPYDAMFDGKRSPDNPSGKNCAYFEGGDYVFERSLEIPLEEQGRKVFLLFESVYKDSEFYLDGKKIGEHDYGYTHVLLDISDFVVFGKKMKLAVHVHNSDQPNSRWYTGSGILQDVHLFTKPTTHFLPFSAKIKTLDYQNRNIHLESTLSNTADVRILIYDKDRKLAERVFENTDHPVWDVILEEAELWDTENPRLYKAVFETADDREERLFGIRQVELDEEKGFLLNGKRLPLLGCCLHSDSGILGAALDRDSERRKARLVKKAGYNAVRSSHNPISSAFLEEADRIGLLVIDEYVDCWYTHKTAYDYASHVTENYSRDLKDMVDKDYCHPSVIFYSIGNEVGETSEKKGIQLTERMVARLHELDDTRPVTCGINVFFNGIAHTPFTQYSDKKAKKDAAGKKTANSSEFFNDLAGLFGADFMKTGALLPIVDRNTKEAFSKLDVAGYNYGIKRYRKDLGKYPHRFLLGTETFSSDARKFYTLWKENPRLLGDFVWAGMDYLGESGIGALIPLCRVNWRDGKEGMILAGAGKMDILGDWSAELLYTRVAFELDPIHVVVLAPRDYLSKHTPSAWSFSMARQSYSFSGDEGMTTKVDVYAVSPYVELYQNGKRIGRKKTKKNGRTSFAIRYWKGDIRAVALDEKGNPIAEETIYSASDTTILSAAFEEESLTMDCLAHLRFEITDERGIRKMNEDTSITIDGVENGELLAFGNACPYNKEGYKTTSSNTYYGTNMAILRPQGTGRLVVHYSSVHGKGETAIDVR